ncbi:S8 family serine peptidase [Maricaulaceae bacterium MS644]
MRKILRSGSAIAAVLSLAFAAEASAEDGQITLQSQAASTTERGPESSGDRLSPSYGQISPFYGQISPFYGQISPFYGQISPFYGQISPFYGQISPFYGQISPFYGQISPFYGQISPFYGQISPFYGQISPFYGQISPFYGQISPFYGQISPFGGEISPVVGEFSPLWGQISPFYGQISPFYGQISPFWGQISPFYSELNPFYGQISPFWGQISPFWGQISPFEGDVSAFWGQISPFYGQISPFYGQISPFWGEIGPFWGQISPFWGLINEAGSSERLGDLVTALETLFGEAETVFGAAITEQTGSSFEAGFLDALLARYGFDLSDPESLLDADAGLRDAFFLDFYDGLMSFAGTDHADHWMALTGWSPALSQSVDGGRGVAVGLLDLTRRTTLASGPEWRDAIADFQVLHGEAVASLIAAPHDYTGAMGVAPNVRLRSFNPYDETLTAGWADVTTGIRRLTRQGSDIVNLSLGVPGVTFDQGWSDVFSDRAVLRHGEDALFVFAAGNDGVAQETEIDWTGALSVENLIIVGSVSPLGNLSSFSNRPGDACFTIEGACGEGQRLMDRFITAPGELLLVDDGQGGTMRVTGTSFATPLVSGAAALVKGGWNWLDGPDIADVLLGSARDAGAPGTDAVFGRGILDIRAAMQPLNTDDLVFFDARGQAHSTANMRVLAGALWRGAKRDRGLAVFEAVNDTYRDFEISLSTLITELQQSDMGEVGAAEAWISEQSRAGLTSFSSQAESTRPLARSGDMMVTAFASEADPLETQSADSLDFQAGVRVENDVTGRRFEFGAGEGAFALSGQSGFNLFADYRPLSGGVNPVLGFASGGAYLAASAPVGENTRFTAGVTSAHDERQYTDPFTGEEHGLIAGVDAYAATAINAALTHSLTDTVTIGAGYTRLMERDALLGAQGAGLIGFGGGAATDAATLNAQVLLGAMTTLDVSATLGRTAATGFDASAVSLSEAAMSTAWQVSVTRTGVFGTQGGLRASLIQPLHMESGALTYAVMNVTDRATGALGLNEERWALDGERRLIGELLYEGPAFGERGAYGLFVRAETEAGAAGGVRFNVRF